MHIVSLAQTMCAIAGLAMIMIGSSWLKRILKH